MTHTTPLLTAIFIITFLITISNLRYTNANTTIPIFPFETTDELEYRSFPDFTSGNPTPSNPTATVRALFPNPLPTASAQWWQTIYWRYPETAKPAVRSQLPVSITAILEELPGKSLSGDRAVVKRTFYFNQRYDERTFLGQAGTPLSQEMGMPFVLAQWSFLLPFGLFEWLTPGELIAEAFMRLDPLDKEQPCFVLSVPFYFLPAPILTPSYFQTAQNAQAKLDLVMLHYSEGNNLLNPTLNRLFPEFEDPHPKLFRWSLNIPWNTYLGGWNGHYHTSANPATKIGQVRPRFITLTPSNNMFLVHNSTRPFSTDNQFQCFLNGIGVNGSILTGQHQFDLPFSQSVERLRSFHTSIQVNLSREFWAELFEDSLFEISHTQPQLLRFGSFNLNCGSNIIIYAPTINENNVWPVKPSLTVHISSTSVESLSNSFSQSLLSQPLPALSDPFPPLRIGAAIIATPAAPSAIFTPEYSWITKAPNTFFRYCPQTEIQTTKVQPREEQKVKLGPLSSPISITQAAEPDPFIIIAPTVVTPTVSINRDIPDGIVVRVIATTILSIESFGCGYQDTKLCYPTLRVGLSQWDDTPSFTGVPETEIEIYFETVVADDNVFDGEGEDRKEKWTSRIKWLTDTESAPFLFPEPFFPLDKDQRYIKLTTVMILMGENLIGPKAPSEKWSRNEIYFMVQNQINQSPTIIPHYIGLERWLLDAKHNLEADTHPPDHAFGNLLRDVVYTPPHWDMSISSTTRPAIILKQVQTNPDSSHQFISQITLHIPGLYEFYFDPKNKFTADQIKLSCANNVHCTASGLVATPRYISFKVSMPMQNTENQPKPKSLSISFGSAVEFRKAEFAQSEPYNPNSSDIVTGNETTNQNNHIGAEPTSTPPTVNLIAHIISFNTTNSHFNVFDLGLTFHYGSNAADIPTSLFFSPQPSRPFWFYPLIAILFIILAILSYFIFRICRAMRKEGEGGESTDFGTSLNSEVDLHVKLIKAQVNTLMSAVNKALDEYQPPMYEDLDPDQNVLPEYDVDMETDTTPTDGRLQQSSLSLDRSDKDHSQRQVPMPTSVNHTDSPLTYESLFTRQSSELNMEITSNDQKSSLLASMGSVHQPTTTTMTKTMTSTTGITKFEIDTGKELPDTTP